MSFTPYTFTSLPLVHTLNPNFLRRHLWLCFLLVREFPRSGNLRAPWLPNLTFNGFPNFADSRSSWPCRFMASSLHEFATPRLREFKIQTIARSRLRDFAGSRFQTIARSRLRDFESSRFQTIARSRLRDFVSSRFQTIAYSRLRDFVGPRFQIFASSLLLRTYFTNFINLDVSRVTGFPEFPNTLYLRLWDIIPKPKNDGNRLVGELLVRAPPVCLGPPCKVLNQSIVGLSPLSETT
jgi:hypothetical protein